MLSIVPSAHTGLPVEITNATIKHPAHMERLVPTLIPILTA